MLAANKLFMQPGIRYLKGCNWNKCEYIARILNEKAISLFQFYKAIQVKIL